MEKNQILGKNLRITVLTPWMIRVEKGEYTDLATQTVWNRDLGLVRFSLDEWENGLQIRTDHVCFRVDYKKGDVVSVTVDGQVIRNFRAGNLLGTARTLDGANGAVKLDSGILSRRGVAVLVDSKSLLLDPDGRIMPRPRCMDKYYFAYGHRYSQALRDFFRLTGPVPLIPKFALGNWWSRYKAYTQEEYLTLMREFIRRKLPVTVATIDMDWHWTDVVSRFGEEAGPARPKCKEEIFFNTFLQGWTGYSWNTELFPDHQALLDWLHENHFRVTLNVHPSQGIRFFENCYGQMCARLGRDPEKKEIIAFDAGDPEFMKAYFEVVHHPLEQEGVDFWWLDWQQGTRTSVPGLDPLWALNHYHSLDSTKGGKRPLILSRYAGLGSHRYPLGFSGDTICSWKSLDFQPYFTNNAANAGYTWWSHDIGGHMQGIQDDALYLRWLQYGVFSPVNRLHSSNSDFMGKEPWKRSWAVENIAGDFLRLRHKLIPYLYTMNYLTHTEGWPICAPMYYRYDCDAAYQAKNQYLFGTQLMVCPVTKPVDRRLNLAPARVWLPQGRWTDFFTDRIYNGGKWVTMYRDLDAIPVLAGEGAILPMYRSGETNDLSLGQPLEIHIWRGQGSFRLYEDDGETMNYAQGIFALTDFMVAEDGDRIRFTITPPGDSHGILPESREMDLRFRDVAAADAYVDGQAVDFGGGIRVNVSNKPVTVELRHVRVLENLPRNILQERILTRVQGNNNWKSKHFRMGKWPKFVRQALEELDGMWYTN